MIYLREPPKLPWLLLPPLRPLLTEPPLRPLLTLLRVVLAPVLSEPALRLTVAPTVLLRLPAKVPVVREVLTEGRLT